MLTTDQKGAIAETAIAHAATKLGIDVYSPMIEGGRYDFIFDIGSRLWRVQCKWASRYRDTLTIRCYSSRRCASGFMRRPYTSGEIDAIAAYSPDLDRCYFLRASFIAGRKQINLRVSAPRNNQAARINWAESFEFAATLGALGAVAQLGERCHGMAEVTGSSPVGSITPP
jgi:PD-(D/E)XK endonuclease